MEYPLSIGVKPHIIDEELNGGSLGIKAEND
jgi:hypothetical protein